MALDDNRAILTATVGQSGKGGLCAGVRHRQGNSPTAGSASATEGDVAMLDRKGAAAYIDPGSVRTDALRNRHVIATGFQSAVGPVGSAESSDRRDHW